MALDWGIGRYEETARGLEPVAATVVDRAGVQPGERALDLGCGTGNVSLELARAGAIVTAIDPASRLVDVTRDRLSAAGLAVDARLGEAAAIPLDAGSLDLVVSVFAVIFAPDPSAAVAEMARVRAGNGRILLTAWVPGYGMSQAYAALGAAAARASGADAPPPRFAWHDPAVLTPLAEAHGLTISVEELELTFTADSPEAQVDLDATNHPMWLDALATLRSGGGDEAAVREQVLASLRQVNESTQGFSTTSRYVIATLR
jgi:SAM-dependent methyltransferase